MATKHQKILRAAFLTPTRQGWGLPICLWDEPGTAKSTLVEAVADLFTHKVDGKAERIPCEILSPGERGEGAFGVTPVPDEGVMTYPAPDWTAKFTEADCGLVLVDELTGAATMLQPALLGLLLDKRIGGHYLGKRVRIFGAANPTDMAAGGYDLSLPATNRMGHIEWEAPNADQWAAWLLGGESEIAQSSDLSAVERDVMKAWPEAWAQARGLVAGFIRAHSSMLHQVPDEGTMDRSRSWPSRRTWEFATRAIASAKVNGLTELEGDEFAASFVGNKCFSEFVHYREEADLPNPGEVLDGVEKFKHNPKRIDRTFAVLYSCAALVAPLDAAKREDRLETFFEIATDVADDAIDVVLNACKILAKADRGVTRFNDNSKELYAKLLEPGREARKSRKAS